MDGQALDQSYANSLIHIGTRNNGASSWLHNQAPINSPSKEDVHIFYCVIPL